MKLTRAQVAMRRKALADSLYRQAATYRDIGDMIEAALGYASRTKPWRAAPLKDFAVELRLTLRQRAYHLDTEAATHLSGIARTLSKARKGKR